MRIRLSNAERLIYRDLLRSDSGLDVLTIWRRYSVIPSRIGIAIRNLVRKGLVEFDGTRAKATKKGMELAFKSGFILSIDEPRPWRMCPEEYKQPPLKIDAPYTPLMRLLDRSSFRKKKLKGQ